MKKLPIKLIIKALIVILLLATLPYYNALFYSFKPSSPFTGSVFYNPYQNLEDNWVKANFHAHSKLAFGLTNGDNTQEQMFEKYDSLGYDLPCLSNYNSITENKGRNFYMNVYEHGINLGFTHQLVINAKQATFFDYPLIQFSSHKQHLLNKLKTKDNLIALAHPSFKVGYSAEEFSFLQNYDLLEVVSARANSIHLWDKALSAGKVLWAIGNDDSHDNKTGNCGIAWTMVNVGKKDNQAVVNSLKIGNCYATRGWMGQEMNRIKFLSIKENTYQLELTEKADSIILISDNGKVVSTQTNANSISYNIKPENTYVRAEIFETEEWNQYTKMFLNPVIRTTDGSLNLDHVAQEISWFKTIAYFLFLIVFHLLLIRVILKW